MRWLCVLLLLVGLPAFAEDPPPPRRPTGQIKPFKAGECKYVESPWGSPCKVDCRLQFVPMFLGTNRIIQFRLLTDKNQYGPSDLSVDFTDREGIEIGVNWEGGTLKWVEVYHREPGKEFSLAPTFACYCNDIELMVYYCIDGKVYEVRPAN